ncbi:MAG: MotA/TolQ/ExbB proton channel family protein [Opitutaceae bacterium]|jgi:biopolymer transport protein ExbB
MASLPLANIVVDTFLHGGLVMWPLLGLSVFALSVIVERLVWRIHASRSRNTERLNQAYQALSRGDSDEAGKLSQNSADPRLRVISYGLHHPGAGLEIAMQVRQAEEMKIARRFITAMDTIVTLAPLLGLLGTVTGIMQSFKFVGGDQELAASKVSGGIGEALIATAFGLGIAIITLIPYNLFGSIADDLHEELDTVIKNVHLLLGKAKPSRHPAPIESVSVGE